MLPYVAIIGAAAAAAVVLVIDGSAARGDAAQRVVGTFAASWRRGDYGGMYALLTPSARRRESLARFAAAYDAAARAATTRSLATGVPRPGRGGGVILPVDVHTQLFGTIGGTIRLRLIATGNGPRITWTPAACFPGLRGAERVTRIMVPSRRGSVLAANGRRLSAGPGGSDSLGAAGETIAGIVGRPTAAQRGAGITSVGITGLERDYNGQLAGRPGAELLLGRRVIAALHPHAGTTIRTTIDPQLQQAAVAALGARLGGVAVVAPATGDVLALAGLALSSAQPPGSSFKIITASAALRAGLTTPGHVYPIASSATLDGFTLRNANGEACGGSLVHAFAVSCNSVFAPLGVIVGAARLVRMAQAYGFDRVPRVRDEVQSSIPSAGAIGGAAALGASAIGQGRILATPLEMATVAATVANGGVRQRPRLLSSVPVQGSRVISSPIAGELGQMMRAVVVSGTGTAAAISGVPIAGKTGTAELRDVGASDTGAHPTNTDAWFVAFPAIPHPPLAAAVMLVGAGAGGASAAPLARTVLLAGLGR